MCPLNQLLLLMCVVVALVIIWTSSMKKKEYFTPDVPTIEKIKVHIQDEKIVDYSGTYLKFLLSNDISEPNYIEQSFYYGCVALKKLGILTNDNMTKLLS